MPLTLSSFGPLTMVGLPGGWFVQGSSLHADNQPQWTQVVPFRITPGPVTEAEFGSVRPLSQGAREFVDEIAGVYRERWKRPFQDTHHPMTCVSWLDHGVFNQIISEHFGEKLHRPTEAQWEYAMRGRPVNIRERMEFEKVKFKDFVKWATGRFENFVTQIEPCARILFQPDDAGLQDLLRGQQDLYAWQVYGTVSGRLFEKGPKGPRIKNAWYDECGKGKANRTREIELPWSVYGRNWEREDYLNDRIDAGLIHSHGMIDGTGNVWNWCEEAYQEGQPWRVFRGGSWCGVNLNNLRLTFRHGNVPVYRIEVVGFRCVAPPQIYLFTLPTP